MGTECQKDYCEEDKQLLDEAEEAARREQEQGLCEQLLAEYAKEMPAIEAAKEERCVECLRENIESPIRALSTSLRDLQIGTDKQAMRALDFKIPSEEQCRIQYEVGMKLSKESQNQDENNPTLRFKFSEHAIVNFPTIYGTDHARPVSAEVTEKIMRALVNLKQDRENWDTGRLDGVMVIDYKTADALGLIEKDINGYVQASSTLRDSQKSPVSVDVRVDEQTAQETGLPDSTKTGEYKAEEIMPVILHIVLGPDGEPLLAGKREQAEGKEPTPEKNVPHGKSWEWTIAHELQHLGHHHEVGETTDLDKMGPAERVFTEHSDEWEKARAAQALKGPVDDPSVYEKRTTPVRREEEFRNQHIAAWETDSSLLCQEMKEFFDNHFAEK